MSKYFTNYKKCQKSFKNKNAFIKDKQCDVKVQHHIHGVVWSSSVGTYFIDRTKAYNGNPLSNYQPKKIIIRLMSNLITYNFPKNV